MPNQVQAHPDASQLTAFLQGRLNAVAQADIERHVASCDSCCRFLHDVPDDTLAASLRNTGAAETMLLTPAADTSPATKASPPPAGVPQELIDHPRYRIVRQLGQGGMGVVYLAEHRLMDRMVAIKVINQRLLSSPTALERFRLEVKAAARLSHSAIVTAHDAEQAGELHFLVTEYIDGVSLHEHVARKGPLNPALACSLIRQAALGLQHASERGMVHRDIKPQNLMVTRKGQLKILDFGLARLAQQETEIDATGGAGQKDGDRGLTLDGVVLGTPDFISPEQVSNSRTVDIRADIYSLGCTFYYLLTGQTPFTGGSSVEKAMAHVRSTPRPIETLRADLPAELTAIVERMMAKDPTDRFQTPGEVAQALSPFIKAAKSASDAAGPAAVETPQPLDALVAAYPLPGQSMQPGYGFSQPHYGSDPLGLHAAPHQDWKRSLKRHRRVLAFGGGAASLLVAVAWAWSMLPSRQSDSPGRNVAFEAPAGPSARDAVMKGGEFDLPMLSEAASKIHQPNVLLVIPHNGFWWKDYEPVRRILTENGIKVVVASSVKGRAEPAQYADGARPVDVELNLGQADAQAFDAVVFIGANVREFMGDSDSGPAAQRLIGRMQAEGRWVTSICKGTAVLFSAGALRDREAAASANIPRPFIEESKGVKWNWDKHVVISDKIITGGSYEHAEEFAQTLVQVLKKQ